MPRIATLAKAAAWMVVIGLVVASWTPGHTVTRTGAGGDLEHLAAYCLAALVFSFAYPRWPPWRVFLAFAAWGALMELGQALVPGRNASVYDWMASAAGAGIGVALAAAWQRLSRLA